MKDKRKGISLIVLVITITVIIILTSAILISSGNTTNEANIGQYREELTQLEDLVKSHYILNNEPPYLSATSNLGKADILNLVGSENSLEFENELILNGDNTPDTIFYKVNLPKLKISHINRGNEVTSNDIYVFAYPSLNVYYLAGVDKYFSISTKFGDIKNPSNDNYGNNNISPTIQTVNGLEVTYEANNWTNNLDVSIKTNMQNIDELFIKISSSGQERKVTTKEGDNNLSFSGLYKLVDGTDNMIAAINLDDINKFISAKNEDKYIDLIKKRNGSEIARVRIDASFLDEIKPTITKNDVELYDSMKLLKLNVLDAGSKIKEIKYEYITWLDETGNNTLNNKGILSGGFLPNDYINNIAKKVEVIDSDLVTLKVPINIKEMIVVAIDNANNITQLYINF